MTFEPNNTVNDDYGGVTQLVKGPDCDSGSGECDPRTLPQKFRSSLSKNIDIDMKLSVKQLRTLIIESIKSMKKDLSEKDVKSSYPEAYRALIEDNVLPDKKVTFWVKNDTLYYRGTYKGQLNDEFYAWHPDEGHWDWAGVDLVSGELHQDDETSFSEGDSPKFSEGDYVRLVANEEEGWEEEAGEILQYQGNGLYLVQVDQDYLDDPADDGLREVLEEYIEEI